jgi:hypothetical protein
MKLRHLTLMGWVFSLFLAFAPNAWADRPQISPGGSLSLSGSSGGPVNSQDCGFIAQTPNHVIQITDDLPYWRIMVTTSGSPTLLIDGPTGRYCMLPEGSANSGVLQYSGYGTPGNYNIYIGDRQQGQNPYRISISDQK